MENNEVQALKEQEFRLAQELKINYCDTTGKETNIRKAGEIFHKIGLIYRKRSPDKISLIKSVGLLNAALIRSPSNVSEIKSDLYEICQHVLQQANAKKQKVDLIEKATEIKTSVEKLRTKVNEILKHSVSKIPTDASGEELQNMKSTKTATIKHLNKMIADQYKNNMANISQFCQDVMGKSPCEFAIVGMGSLAREEITPYSDFEHVIVLCDKTKHDTPVKYFRWYSTIFHVIVLNLQESIIPSLNIHSLNDESSHLHDWYYDGITPRGISFDGMMPHACKFPLGRQQLTENKPFITELIKPVNEMLDYLSSEADLKNGYHLSDILTKTCFVYGNKDVFDKFYDGVENYRKRKTRKEIIADVKQQVLEDMNKFSTRFRLSNLMEQKAINIKQLIYRSTTIFISALGRIYKIFKNSCFDIIEEIAANNNCSPSTAEQLQYAIAIACEMRLRVYMENKSQCDNAIDLKGVEQNLKKFLGIVGVASTINYFQIAYCLQCEVAKQLNFSKLHFYSNPTLVNIAIGLTFQLNKLTNFSNFDPKRDWSVSQFNFDKCIETLEATTTLNPNLLDYTSQSSCISTEHIESIAYQLSYAQIYDESTELYKQLIRIYQRQLQDENCDVARVNHRLGFHFQNLKQYNNALVHFQQAIEIYQNKVLDGRLAKEYASTLHSAGSCYSDLQQYDKALNHLMQALEMYQNTSCDVEKDNNVSVLLNNIGLCKMNMRQNEHALIFFVRSLTIKHSLSPDVEKDKYFGFSLHNLASCQMKMAQHDDALKNLQQVLEIYFNITTDYKTDNHIANIEAWIGDCYFDMKQYDKSLDFYIQALEIRRNRALDGDRDREIALVLDKVARCHLYLHHYDDALKNLQQTLKIYQLVAKSEVENKGKFARIYEDIAYCFIKRKHFDDALKHLKMAKNAYKNLPLSQQVTNKITQINSQIKQCEQLGS